LHRSTSRYARQRGEDKVKNDFNYSEMLKEVYTSFLRDLKGQAPNLARDWPHSGVANFRIS
jgi:hypothetical protein